MLWMRAAGSTQRLRWSPEGSKLIRRAVLAANRWGQMSRQLDFDEAVPVDGGTTSPP